MKEWNAKRGRLFAGAQARSAHDHAELIKSTTGNRLQKYSTISEMDFVLEKNYARTIDEVWIIDDAYVTLAMCHEIENSDIQRKISDSIQKLSK